LELGSLSKFGITLSWSSASAFPGDAQSKFVLYRESTAIGEYELDGTHTDTLYPRGTINSYFGIVKVLEPGVPIAGEVENLSFPSEKLDVAGPVRRIDPTESNNIISVNWETQRQLLRKFGY
jgi:hypothetical protein